MGGRGSARREVTPAQRTQRAFAARFFLMFAAAVSATAPKGPTTIQKVHHSFGGGEVRCESDLVPQRPLLACFGARNHDGGSVRRADRVNVHRHLAHVAPPRAPMRSK